VPPGDPQDLDELMAATRARGHRLFSGRLDGADLGLGERLIARIVHAPSGDFRDWDAIRTWAREIGSALLAASPDRQGAATSTGEPQPMETP
jgi:menaquinone-dependent protoporphyrinogen oxidase